jgi:hypothetical protein
MENTSYKPKTSVSFAIFSTKRWADYEDEDNFLPFIPWAPYVKPVSLKQDSSSEWVTVKSKKKKK